MKILLVYYHFEVCGGRYYLDAFKRLGHDVRHIGQQMSVKDAWGLQNPVPEKYAHKPDDGTLTRNGFWSDWTPDLILVCDSMMTGEHYHHEYYSNVPHAVIAIDNHVRDYDGDWAHQFLAHYHGPTYPVDPARKDHSWLPCASDPMFTPSPIPWSEREYDVCCIGVMYPRRQEVVAALREAGLKVRAETGLLYEEYRDAYWNARISLCVSAEGDVAQRIFETGRMGCAILTDPLLDFADETTNKALGIYSRMTYTNPAEAVQCARDLLGNPMTFNIGVVQQQTQVPIGEGAALALQQHCKPHTWDARARVIVDWYEREYGKAEHVAELTGGVTATEAMKHFNAIRDEMDKPIGVTIDDQTVLINNLEPLPDKRPKPFLNLGCGRTHLPGERPAHHGLIPADIYSGREWVNVDRAHVVDADCVFDLFAYPWPLESDSYDGALLSHLCEHIPHEINLIAPIAVQRLGTDGPLYDLRGKMLDKAERAITQRRKELSQLQDGWFAFFAELYRVLTPGAEVHILSPHARSDGAIGDPTHTRYLLPDSFNHSMQPNPDAPFEYATGGIHFEIVGQTFGVSQEYMHLTPQPSDPPDVQQAKSIQLEHLSRTQNNIIPEFYVRLKVVK